MKASRFLGNKTFAVTDLPTPHAGPGELVLRNQVCGVCGTDVHIYHGEPGSADVNPPVVLGHEYSGEVVEVGEGAIGLLMVQLAKLSGASQIVLSEPNEKRRQVGLQLGANAALDPTRPDAQEAFAQVLDGGANVVIECVGNVPAVKSAFQFAGKGATVLLFSVPKVDATFDLPLFDVYKKELTIKGSFVNPDTHARAVALINSGKVDFGPTITHRFPLDQLPEAIAMQMSDASIKVVVEAQ